MNNLRQLEFFNPTEIHETVHIIGVGAVGSYIANNLVRMGFKKLVIWDYDEVEDINIPNQLYREIDINKPKTVALTEYLTTINSDIKIEQHGIYTDEKLSGFVFICVDSIETRKKIYEDNKFNIDIEAIIDTRIGLEDGQIYSADWHRPDHIKALQTASDFTKDEVEVPVSACGTKLAVLPTTMICATLATSNLINFIKTGEINTTILFNAFDFYIKKYNIRK